MLTDLPSSWSHTDENVATLVDLQTYWLSAEYVKWTTDAAEAKRAAASREKPPPMPLIQPVARRPRAAHEAAVRRYEELRSRAEQPDESAHRQWTARELWAHISGSV